MKNSGIYIFFFVSLICLVEVFLFFFISNKKKIARALLQLDVGRFREKWVARIYLLKDVRKIDEYMKQFKFPLINP